MYGPLVHCGHVISSSKISSTFLSTHKTCTDEDKSVHFTMDLDIPFLKRIQRLPRLLLSSTTWFYELNKSLFFNFLSTREICTDEDKFCTLHSGSGNPYLNKIHDYSCSFKVQWFYELNMSLSSSFQRNATFLFKDRFLLLNTVFSFKDRFLFFFNNNVSKCFNVHFNLLCYVQHKICHSKEKVLKLWIQWNEVCNSKTICLMQILLDKHLK